MENQCSDKKDILNRLSRLEGQVRGVRKMVDREQDCEKILIQVSAVHAALEGVTRVMLLHFLEECMEKAALEGQEGGEEALKEKLANLLLKTRF